MAMPASTRHFRHLFGVAFLLVLAGCALDGKVSNEDGGTGPDGGAGTPGFTVAVSPNPLRIGLNDSTTANVLITFTNGFSATRVDLTLSGLPANVTASFAPNPLPHEGVSILTIRAAANAAPGTYPLVVSATAKGITNQASALLNVTATPDFTLSVAPLTQSVAAGGTVSFEATLGSMNGFVATPVTLSVSVQPAGVGGTFSPNPITPPGTSTLTLATSPSASAGTFALTITGSGGGQTHTATATLIVTSAGSGWTTQIVGNTGDGNNSVLVGPGRNDGVNRLYVGTVSTGQVWEYSFSGGAWSSGTVILSASAAELHNMGMGPGRNDGVTRIYAASLDGNLYELSYGSGSWPQRVIGFPGGGATHATVGNGRNDGVNRVYATFGSGAYEYTWNGTAFTEVRLAPISGAHGVALGTGRSDGVQRVYVAQTGGNLYELSYSGGSWTSSPMGSFGDVRNVGIGMGRNDGINRVYAASWDQTEYELSYDSGTQSWATSAIGSIGTGWLIHADVTAGRNDGLRRVYASAGDGNTYEFSWSAGSWTRINMGGGSGYMYGMNPGVGRNDGVIRIYAASFDHHVYEYTWQ